MDLILGDLMFLIDRFRWQLSALYFGTCSGQGSSHLWPGEGAVGYVKLSKCSLFPKHPVTQERVQLPNNEEKGERVWTNRSVARGGWLECAGPVPLFSKDCVVSACPGLVGRFPCRPQHSRDLWHTPGPPGHITEFINRSPAFCCCYGSIHLVAHHWHKLMLLLPLSDWPCLLLSVIYCSLSFVRWSWGMGMLQGSWGCHGCWCPVIKQSGIEIKKCSSLNIFGV